MWGMSEFKIIQQRELTPFESKVYNLQQENKRLREALINFIDGVFIEITYLEDVHNGVVISSVQHLKESVRIANQALKKDKQP